MCLPLEGGSVIFTSIFGPLVTFILLSRLCVRGFVRALLGKKSQSQGREKEEELEEAALKEGLF